MSSSENDANLQKQLLGEILIKRKVITEEQLNHALTVQKKEGEVYVKKN